MQGNKVKTVREAVEDGSLVDVSEQAKKEGMPYPTFMSPGLIAKYESLCPGVGVMAQLSYFACLLSDYNYDIYGPVFSGDHVCIIEPNDEYGHVVLILEEGKAEELGLVRSTGDRYEYLM